MQKLTYKFRSISLDYYISGTSPKVLFHSGTHGDEYSSINLITQTIHQYESVLPDFIYVPHVSPSAISQKTRVNLFGRDLNRNFFSNSPDSEIQANINLIGTYHFSLCVSFHEDWEYSDFYIYDYGPSPINQQHLKQFQDNLTSKNIGLYTGTDDIEDPHLGYSFINGYTFFPNSQPSTSSGMLDDWCFRHQVAERVLVPEIPINATHKQKSIIINEIFQHLVLPNTLTRSPHLPEQKISIDQTSLSNQYLLQDFET